MLLPQLILVVSQTSLSLMMVILGILLLGISYGLLKNKDSLLRHRWVMTVAVFLACWPILMVMLPTAYNILTDPALQLISSQTVLILLHGVVGAFTITFGLLYVSGDLPAKVKSGMRWTTLLWVSSIVLGLVIFLQLFGLL
jgi:hypothetical protein